MAAAPTELSQDILDMLAEASDAFGGSPSQAELADIVQHAFDMAKAEQKELRMKGIARTLYLGNDYGRPKIPQPKNWPEVYDALQNREITQSDAIAQLHISKSTLTRWIKAERKKRRDLE